MLKYKSDIRSLLFLGLYYGLFAVSWWVLPFTWQAMVPAVLLLCTLNFMVAITIHNTIHCPIFKKRWANLLHFILLSLAFGSPASGYVPGHNLSHHKHLQTAKDNTRTWKMRFRWNFLNQLLFFFVMIPGIIRTEGRFLKIAGPEKPKWHKQYRVEVAFCWIWKVVFLILDPWRFLFLLFLPNMYAVWGIFGTNFWQHDGCDERHPYNHSRNFTGRLFNFLVCNNGYHGAHHMRPNMHWSLYPAFHAKEIKPNLHPALEQKSILLYLWKTCVFPGRRLTFEGKEVILPPNVPDEDWVAEVGTSSWKAEDMAEA